MAESSIIDGSITRFLLTTYCVYWELPLGQWWGCYPSGVVPPSPSSCQLPCNLIPQRH